MSPFISSSVLRAAALPHAAGSKRVIRPLADDNDDAEDEREAEAARELRGAAAGCSGGCACGDAFLRRCCFDLFGVVSHRGDMSAGHYVAYVKAAGSWYKCDDAWVLLADGEQEVGRCQPYMLFYQQRNFMQQHAAAGGLNAAAAAAVTAAAAKATADAKAGGL